MRFYSRFRGVITKRSQSRLLLMGVADPCSEIGNVTSPQTYRGALEGHGGAGLMQPALSGN